MWQVAVAAVVAGSGLIAKHMFSPKTIQTQPNNNDSQLIQTPNQKSSHLFSDSNSFESQIAHETNFNGEERDGVFRFSSFSSPSSSSKKHRNLGKKIRVVGKNEDCFDGSNASICQRKKNCGKKVTVSLKRRKICRNPSGNNFKPPISKDCSFFGWGLSMGILCMMSAGKAEISKLGCTINETAKVVNELKSELNKQKSLQSHHQLLNSSDSRIGVDTIKKPVEVRENNDSCSLSKHPIETKHLGENEYASSVLTEEHQQEGVEMDQLEAELESEFQKLSWCEIEASTQIERPAMNRSLISYHSNGVHPAELENKLSNLLIEQQESHISDLESELNSAYSKLQEKEAELRTLKECVRRLTEFSLSTVSDEETEVREELGELDHNSLVLSDNATVGTKRAMHFS